MIMQKLKEILIVDDDTTAQLINRIAIHKMEITENIVVKSDGFQALTFLKEKCALTTDECSDLILLDLNMPVINGFNFLQALRDMNWESVIHSKVVILSSSSYEEDTKKAATYGVRGFIEK